jgi:hypothetical protein
VFIENPSLYYSNLFLTWREREGPRLFFSCRGLISKS